MNPRDNEKVAWWVLSVAICSLFWAILFKSTGLMP